MNEKDIRKAAEAALRMIKEAAGATPPQQGQPQGPPPLAPTPNTYGSPVGSPSVSAIPKGSDPLVQNGLPSATDAARMALAYIGNRKKSTVPPANH